jgi:hypothetical protein
MTVDRCDFQFHLSELMAAPRALKCMKHIPDCGKKKSLTILYQKQMLASHCDLIERY